MCIRKVGSCYDYGELWKPMSHWIDAAARHRILKLLLKMRWILCSANQGALQITVSQIKVGILGAALHNCTSSISMSKFFWHVILSWHPGGSNNVRYAELTEKLHLGTVFGRKHRR
jgi:hypothetical protein